MKLYKSAKVAGTISTEETTDLLTGTDAEPKHVDGIYFTEYTAGGENHDATIRVFKDTVKIAEIYLYHFAQAFDSDVYADGRFLELDVDLPAGVKLEVGHLSGATASDIAYTAKYEVGRR